mmetsp:Transcript_45973/g.127634  ORF Transcript_45973/g.127634 Transcript_45973/m.127634 type:complete len:111 (-) Transcript_45973:164-496(-)
MASSLGVEKITDMEMFEKVRSENAVVVHFMATWCESCSAFAAKFEELAKKNGSLTFCTVDVDSCEDIADKFEVEVMPTFILLKGEDEPVKVVGADAADLSRKIAEFERNG